MSKLAFCICCLLAAPLMGVQTSYWTQTTEADFRSGVLENVVATNLGDLKLSRAVKTLLEQDPRISAVNALAEAPDGSVYAGTGPHGIVLRIKGGQVQTLVTLDDAAAVTSLLVDKGGAILLGTAGENGRVLKIAKPGEKPSVLFEAKGVQYVWALVQAADGAIYAATGPAGRIYEIKPDGSSKTLLETDQNNITCLISDGKDTLYAGTDTNGLVYRINRKTAESFVLYNAAETEVSALALDKQGNLYAATAEAKEEPGGPMQEAGEQEKNGRPEGGSVGVPIPADRPKEPAPAPPPDPNPGRPDPIPKSPRARTRGPAGGAQVFFALDTDFPPESLPAAGPNKKPVKPKPTPPPGGPNPNPGPVPGPKPPKPAPPGSPEPAPATGPGATIGHQPPVDTTAAIEPRPEGNAVYKIDPDGFVTEVFRQPMLILSMIESNGALLVATGGTEGQVYQVRPAADETLVLAKVEAKEIMSMLLAKDGHIYLGTANVGSLASMSSGYADRGTFTSPVLDATQISRFGKMQLHGTLPPGTALTVATRSGNMKEADEKSWSKWSDESPAAQFMAVTSPAARFLQYRLSLSSPAGKASPVVEDITVAYQVPNLPPRIKAVKLAIAGGATGEAGEVEAAPPRRVESARRQTISWEASDPNNDALTYTLWFRQVGEESWILLKEKLTESSYEWDTRTVADGRYEVKVSASDAVANPPGMGKTTSRVSDPITIDNTPPVIGDLKSRQKGAAVQVDLKVVDRTSTVAAVDYSVDSNKDWQFVLPVDQIYDSPQETVSFAIPNLTPGQHQITLRATDAKGNQSFQTLMVNVQGPAAAK